MAKVVCCRKMYFAQRFVLNKNFTIYMLDCLLQVALLLLTHSAKNLNAQEERLATSPYLVTRLHLPHAILVRLHVLKINVVILTPETAVAVGV